MTAKEAIDAANDAAPASDCAAIRRCAGRAVRVARSRWRMIRVGGRSYFRL